MKLSHITFPGSLCGLGTFRKHLFKERLCRIEFCLKEEERKKKDSNWAEVWRFRSGIWNRSGLPSSLHQLCCSMEISYWSMCRCHSDSAASQAPSLLPSRSAWRSCVAASLWNLEEEKTKGRVEVYLAPLPVLSFCLLSLSLSGESSSPAVEASRCWSDLSSALTSWWPKLLMS